jgi:inositol transporter-like SP family MFS transporter
MRESEKWEAARRVASTSPGARQANWRVLLKPRHLKSMIFLIAMYGLWNLWAGTNGFFFPYILRTVGSQTQGTSVLLQAGGFDFDAVHIPGFHASV